MLRKHAAFLSLAVLLGVLLVVNVNFVAVSGWSNGGFSADPDDPDYGTHDWIAEHALDWLPQQEKQFLLDNVASFLYGTELPDNWQVPDGVGGTGKHHVYYFVNGSLQDDACAVRAREEYVKAVEFFEAGNFSEAAKRLGMVVHYVADMGVFGHVMGAAAVWGAETHHSDYESYVNENSDNYTDTFSSFLVFDGNFFDVDGDLTCVWMDQNYNWSNATFRNRCGESLNLAVNLIADVLHTFYAEVIIPEFPTGFVVVVFVVLSLPVVVFVRKKRMVRAWENN